MRLWLSRGRSGHQGKGLEAHVGLAHAGERVGGLGRAVLPRPEPVEQARQVHGHEEDAGHFWVALALRAVQQVLVQRDVDCATAQPRSLLALLKASCAYIVAAAN